MKKENARAWTPFWAIIIVVVVGYVFGIWLGDAGGYQRGYADAGLNASDYSAGFRDGETSQFTICGYAWSDGYKNGNRTGYEAGFKDGQNNAFERIGDAGYRALRAASEGNRTYEQGGYLCVELGISRGFCSGDLCAQPHPYGVCFPINATEVSP